MHGFSRTKLWSWKPQHMCRFILVMSRPHTPFDFWSSADTRIAYFCMPQTAPLFTSLGRLGLTGSKVEDLTGMLWELLVSAWLIRLSTTYRGQYHCLLKHSWKAWKTTSYINPTSWSQCPKGRRPSFSFLCSLAVVWGSRPGFWVQVFTRLVF